MIKNMRYQDNVARVSGINLKSVVRVLRALPIVARASGDDELADIVEKILLESTVNNGQIRPLDDKPADLAIEAGQLCFDRVINNIGFHGINKLQRLEECPYGGCQSSNY